MKNSAPVWSPGLSPGWFPSSNQESEQEMANLVVKQWKEHLSQSLSPEQIEPRVFVRAFGSEIKVSEFESFKMNLGMNTDTFGASSQWYIKGSSDKKKDSKAVPADEEPGIIGPDSMGMKEGPDMGERGKGGATEDAGKATKDVCRDSTKDMKPLSSRLQKKYEHQQTDEDEYATHMQGKEGEGGEEPASEVQ
ncbi:hypothetical protein B0H10DRAFT_1959365 [Mycena sp. CBHHK59/15]|nr:hypothetical protein B0H10DRAFT_1959365 [Mycena sp. CBHHK59/15]